MTLTTEDRAELVYLLSPMCTHAGVVSQAECPYCKEEFSEVLRRMINRRETPMELDRIADVVLNYRPKRKANKPKARKRRKAK